MELALSLGDALTSKPPCMPQKQAGKTGMGLGLDLGLGICTALDVSLGVASMGGFYTNRAPSAERMLSRTDEDDDDDEEMGLARKRLRLSEEQSAFLEKSFNEHTTLNPKQKAALAKELNLQPRQVQVWFQNRRARMKLKQTEVDCENLKRCYETLAEENRWLQWELAHLRALKAAHPLYTKTTLSICPSCKSATS